MKQHIRPAALLLTIAGGVNWLTVALFDLNMVNYILRDLLNAQKAVYIIIGLSSLLSISLFEDICTFCNNDKDNNRKNNKNYNNKNKNNKNNKNK